MGQEAGAGNVIRIVEAMPLIAAVGNASEVILMIFRGQEGAEVVIEPPGDFGRRRVLKVDDGVLVARKVGLIKQGASAMNEAPKLVSGPGRNAFLMKTAE
jgi:hypothetical protein